MKLLSFTAFHSSSLPVSHPSFSLCAKSRIPGSRFPAPLPQSYQSNWFQHLHRHQLIRLLGFTSDILFASDVCLLCAWLTHSQRDFLVSAWPRAPFLRKCSAQASNLLNTTSYLPKTLRWFLLPHLIFRVRETSNPQLLGFLLIIFLSCLHFYLHKPGP